MASSIEPPSGGHIDHSRDQEFKEYIFDKVYMVDRMSIESVPPEYLKNRRFLQILLESHPTALEHLEAVQDDDELVNLAIGVDAAVVAFASERFKKGCTPSQFLHYSVVTQFQFDRIPVHLRESKDFITQYIRLNPVAYQFLGDELKSDPEIVEIALEHSDLLICHVPEAVVIPFLLERVELIRHLSISDSDTFNRYADQLKGNRSAFLMLVKHARFALTLTPLPFSNDKEVVMHILLHRPQAFELIDPSLQSDIDVIEVAVRGDCSILASVSKDLLGNEAVMRRLLKISGSAYSYLSDRLKRNQALAHYAVAECSTPLSMIDDALRDNRDIALAAVGNRPGDYEHVSDRLKLDRDFALDAVSLEPTLYVNLAKPLQQDEAIVTRLIELHPFAIEWIKPNLPFYINVAIIAVQKEIKLFKKVAPQIRAKRKFLLPALFSGGDKGCKIGEMLSRKVKKDGSLYLICEAIVDQPSTLTHFDPDDYSPAHLVPLYLLIFARSGGDLSRGMIEALQDWATPLRKLYRNQESNLERELLSAVNLLFIRYDMRAPQFMRRLLTMMASDVTHRDEATVPFLESVSLFLRVHEADSHSTLFTLIENCDDLPAMTARLNAYCANPVEAILKRKVEGASLLKEHPRSFNTMVNFAIRYATSVVSQAFISFVGWIAEGTFLEERMNVKGNQSLSWLQKHFTPQYDMWSGLHGKGYEGKSHRVVVSDNWEDFICMGDEVKSSCLSVTSPTSNSEGLMSYCIDGSNHLLVIRDEKGNIGARANLRLIYVDQKPALFLFKTWFGKNERSTDEVEEDMMTAAQKIAVEIKMPLYGEIKNERTVASTEEGWVLSGKAPLLYWDLDSQIHRKKFTFTCRNQYKPLADDEPAGGGGHA